MKKSLFINILYRVIFILGTGLLIWLALGFINWIGTGIVSFAIDFLLGHVVLCVGILLIIWGYIAYKLW